MYYHHDVHHAGYVNNLNALLGAPALADDIFLQNSGLTSLIMHIGTKKMANLSSDQQTLLRNNAGGHWNHASYWRLMAKNGSSAQPNLNSSFALAVARDFGSLTNMIAEINRSGAARFGSGWSWLVMNKTSNRLQVHQQGHN
jgi:Fe-Mn family superoxide dismutase